MHCAVLKVHWIPTHKSQRKCSVVSDIGFWNWPGVRCFLRRYFTGQFIYLNDNIIFHFREMRTLFHWLYAGLWRDSRVTSNSGRDICTRAHILMLTDIFTNCLISPCNYKKWIARKWKRDCHEYKRLYLFYDLQIISFYAVLLSLLVMKM